MTVRYFGYAVESAGTRAGRWGHAEGIATRADGEAAHAEGSNTLASGRLSHAEGAACEATGNFSHAQNAGAIAAGHYSHAGGSGGQAETWAAFVHGFGHYTRSQFSFMALAATTTSMAQTPLTADAAQSFSASPTNSPLIRERSANAFDLLLVSRRQGTGASPMVQGWRFTGIVARDYGSGARIVGTPTQIATWSDGSNNGTVSITTVSTPLQTLAVYVTPAISTGVHWQGLLMMNELTGT